MYYNFDLQFFKTPIYPTDSTYTYVNFVLAYTTSKNQQWPLTILVSIDGLQLVFLLVRLQDSALMVPIPALGLWILWLQAFFTLVILTSIVQMTFHHPQPVTNTLLLTSTSLPKLPMPVMVNQINILYQFLLLPDSLLLFIMALTKMTLVT